MDIRKQNKAKVGWPLYFHLKEIGMRWIFAFLLLPSLLWGQTWSPDWQQAGLSEGEWKGVRVEASRFGLRPGAADEAMERAFTYLRGKQGVLEVDSGTYHFSLPLRVPPGVVIRGKGANKTHFVFDLNDPKQHAIQFMGKMGQRLEPTGPSAPGSAEICLKTEVTAGSWLWVGQVDSSKTSDNWAHQSFGELVQVVKQKNACVTLSHPLPWGCDLQSTSKIQVVEVHAGGGLQNLRITNAKIANAQQSTIYAQWAVNLRFEGLWMQRSNYAHIDLRQTTHAVVRGNHLEQGHAYGSGGKAYGVVLHSSTSYVLVENNSFQRLRHSILLQSGAHANVLAYNWSTDPYWNQGMFPSDAAGDLVLHGNYPYGNLFEGNVAENLVVDNSHGLNGPGNVFFRNQVLGYGVLIMNFPPHDGQVLWANRVENNGFLKGMYLINGSHDLQGNWVNGSLAEPNRKSWPKSLYAVDRPSFISASTWPVEAVEAVQIPAQMRQGQPQDAPELQAKKKSWWKRLFGK